MSDTPIRTVRIDDELWTAAQERARRRRESVADVIRRALLAYVEDDGLDHRLDAQYQHIIEAARDIGAASPLSNEEDR